MQRRESIKFSMFIFVLVIISFSSYIIPISSKQFSCSPISIKKGDYLEITNFNDFKIISNSEIISDVSENQITFDNNFTGEGWATESYFLNFKKFGNVTDCEIYLVVNYYCSITSDLGMFSLSLETNYSSLFRDYSDTKQSLCNIYFGSGFTNDLLEYGINTINIEGRKADYYFPIPLYDTFTFHIKKEGNTISCDIFDEQVNKILSYRWNDYINYVYASGLELFFSAKNSTDFSADVKSFSAKIEIENRNWKWFEIRDTIIYSISGIIIGIVIILSGIYIFKSIARQMNRTKTKEQIQLEQEFRAWDEKLSPERVLIITNLKFEGKTKKDDKCGICKTSIKHGKEVYQCHNCETLFHKNHLIEWFKKKDTCPVCKTKLL